MDERAERIGLNEALFREINERLEELGEVFGQRSETEFVCECGRRDCSERLVLTPAEYAYVRSNPHWFAIRPGHVIADVESVISENERFALVEKHAGDPTAVAAATDPRS